MMKSIFKKLTVLIFCIIFFTACNTHNNSTEEVKHPKLPVPDHIVIVIEENHSYSQIIGSSNAPYITALSKDSSSANFVNAYATTHPSQPNYLNFFSGSTQGVTDNTHPVNAPF